MDEVSKGFPVEDKKPFPETKQGLEGEQSLTDFRHDLLIR